MMSPSSSHSASDGDPESEAGICRTALFASRRRSAAQRDTRCSTPSASLLRWWDTWGGGGGGGGRAGRRWPRQQTQWHTLRAGRQVAHGPAAPAAQQDTCPSAALCHTPAFQHPDPSASPTHPASQPGAGAALNGTLLRWCRHGEDRLVWQQEAGRAARPPPCLQAAITRGGWGWGGGEGGEGGGGGGPHSWRLALPWQLRAPRRTHLAAGRQGHSVKRASKCMTSTIEAPTHRASLLLAAQYRAARAGWSAARKAARVGSTGGCTCHKVGSRCTGG